MLLSTPNCLKLAGLTATLVLLGLLLLALSGCQSARATTRPLEVPAPLGHHALHQEPTPSHVR